MQQQGCIVGVDEVGRGPLAGPVVAAAVILNPEDPIDGLMDSKLLSEKKREILSEIIQQKSLAWAIGRAEVSEIDTLNILQASLLAMQRAVLQLKGKIDCVLVDGCHCPVLPYPVKAEVKGDQRIPVISAASIIAKVARDREMTAYAKEYPGYGFEQHKGYGTKMHLQALKMLGVTPIHRQSFSPVRESACANHERTI